MENSILKRELTFGVYNATERFNAIKQHSCVCFKDDMGLVASTGPAGDRESEQYAELFAAAPDLYAALDGLIETLLANKRIYWNNALHEAAGNAKSALRKARGEP